MNALNIGAGIGQGIESGIRMTTNQMDVLAGLLTLKKAYAETMETQMKAYERIRSEMSKLNEVEDDIQEES